MTKSTLFFMLFMGTLAGLGSLSLYLAWLLQGNIIDYANSLVKVECGTAPTIPLWDNQTYDPLTLNSTKCRLECSDD